MEITHGAVAGSLESSDILVKVSPNPEGIQIDLTSSVEQYYGDSIRKTIADVLHELNISHVMVEAVDHGALDCTIRARLTAAVARAAEAASRASGEKTEGESGTGLPRGGKVRRSMLFIPANNPNMIVNSAQLGADSLIFDLEDAVSPDEKDTARELLKNALRSMDFGRCERIVRINGLESPYWEKDLEAVIPFSPDAIMPPKVCDSHYITRLEQALAKIERDSGIPEGQTKIIALLETAAGVENACEIAKASPRMAALFLGAEDLTADLRCQRTKEGSEIQYARGRIVCGARAAGIEAYDTPFTDVQDMEGLERDAAYAKRLGFTGKACISPGHVAAVNRIFSPSPAEITWATEVFAAIAEAKRQGKGAIALRGKMIDAPIVQRARLVLAAASEIEGVDYFA